MPALPPDRPRTRIFDNFSAQSAAAPKDDGAQTPHHEYGVSNDRTRGSNEPPIRTPSPGRHPGVFRRSRKHRSVGAGSPVASNPRCAPGAQSRGLFRSERLLSRGALDRQWVVHRDGRAFDRCQRRVRRSGFRRSGSERQRRSGARRFGSSRPGIPARQVALRLRAAKRSDQHALDATASRRRDIFWKPALPQDVAGDLDDDVVSLGVGVVVEPGQSLQA